MADSYLTDKNDKEYFGQNEMHLSEIGLKMHNWHSGQFDPIYMVGSYFVNGEHYPNLQIVADAADALSLPLSYLHKRPLPPEDVQELNDLIDALSDYLDHFGFQKQIAPDPNFEEPSFKEPFNV